MKEKWMELQTILEEMQTMKKREYFLTLAVCVLAGLVVGMLISPRRMLMVGSNNGNNNVTGKGKCRKDRCEGEEFYDWED